MEPCLFVTLEDLANFSTVEHWQAMHGVGDAFDSANEVAKHAASISADSYEIACSPPPLGESFSPLSRMMTLESALPSSDHERGGRRAATSASDMLDDLAKEDFLEQAATHEPETDGIFELEL